jgi:hypothetical protein
MSNDLPRALAAVREWHSRQTETLDQLKRFWHGQRVVKLGDDRVIYRILGFDWSEQLGWQTKTAKLGEDHPPPYPLISISEIKPVDENTLH